MTPLPPPSSSSASASASSSTLWCAEGSTSTLHSCRRTIVCMQSAFSCCDSGASPATPRTWGLGHQSLRFFPTNMFVRLHTRLMLAGLDASIDLASNEPSPCPNWASLCQSCRLCVTRAWNQAALPVHHADGNHCREKNFFGGLNFRLQVQIRGSDLGFVMVIFIRDADFDFSGINSAMISSRKVCRKHMCTEDAC